MPRRANVPEDLTHGPFTTEQARRCGVTPTMLRSAVWRPVLRGVHVLASVPDSAAVRRAALALVLDDGLALAGLSAAWVHGVWEPPPWRPVPLVRTRPIGGSRLLRRGTTGRRQVLDDDLVDVGGLAVTSVERTCFDLMRDVPLVEAVTVADAFVSSGRVLGGTLAEYVAPHYRWPGVRTARLAVELCSDRVLSPPESRLRMTVVLAGLPEPLVNSPLHVETGAGDVVRYPDLLVTVRRLVAVEYDGGYHDDDQQQDDDAERENLIVAGGGIPVLRYRKKTLYGRPQRCVDEIARTCGVRPLNPLDPRDFAMPRHRPPW